MLVSLSCSTRLVGLADCYHADGCARKRLNDANDWLAIAQVQTQTAFPLKLPLTPKSPVDSFPPAKKTDVNVVFNPNL
jgi:hypothetical protein